MSKFNGHTAGVETAASWAVVNGLEVAERYSLFVGLDVHKDTIAVAIAYPGRGEPVYRGEIAHTAKAMRKLVEQLHALTGGGLLRYCYEAGPCGYGLYRQLLGMGVDCDVVAPSRRAT